MQIEEYAKHTQFYTGELPPLLRGLLTTESWESLADLGCGDGALLAALNSERYLDGKSVFAVDLSKSRIHLIKQINENFNCLQKDACDTGLENGSIDILLSTQVIEHVANDGDMVREIDRVLSPNGTVYLSTIFKKWYGWYFYRCNGKWTIDPTHVREYSSDEELLGLFLPNGLKVEMTRKVLRKTPLLDAILRRVGAGRGIYENRILRFLRKITLPIPGYYIWEIVCKKP